MAKYLNKGLFLFFIYCSLAGKTSAQYFKAAGTPANPKVPITWNRYNDSKTLIEVCKKIASKYPSLAKWSRIGRSYQGRELLVLTITDYKKGNPSVKPGIYIQGNLHGAEIQGSEASLYIAWYLTENYATSDYIKELLADKVFYIAPTLNPDSRDYFMLKPARFMQPRYTQLPFDSDGDGKLNEDGCDDLDGDGNITQMRVKNMFGAYIKDPNFPQNMIRLPEDSIVFGNNRIRSKLPSSLHYDIYSEGGIDDDGDGRIDEDGIISDSTNHYQRKDLMRLDPNRNWGWSWDPNTKDEAVNFAFSLLEIKAARDFIVNHPNISLGFSFHNKAQDGFFPGVAYKRDYFIDGKSVNDSITRSSEKTSKSDATVYDNLSIFRKLLFPGETTLYNVDAASPNGREVDWMFGYRGFYSYLAEIGGFGSGVAYQNYSKGTGQSQIQFSNSLLLGDGYVAWKEFDHPILGKLEIGGKMKAFEQVAPGFALEDELHRLMAFVINCSYQTPKLVFKKLEVIDQGNGIDLIKVVIANIRAIPTHSSQDLRHNIQPPDYVVLETKDIILSNSVNTENTSKITIENIPGNSEVEISWNVKRNTGEHKVVVKSVKGGSLVIQNKK